MNNTILRTIAVLLVSSSLSIAADIGTLTMGYATTATSSSPPLPSGDTAPLGPIEMTVAPLPAYMIALPTEISLDHISTNRRFSSIDFVDNLAEEGKTLSETQKNENIANKFLRDKFCDKAAFSAHDVLDHVLSEAHRADFNNSIRLLFNCAKSLRHISSIAPSGMVESVFTGNIVCSKLVTYHPEMLQVSKILHQIALHFADSTHQIRLKSRIEESLSSTERHISEVAAKIMEKREEIAREEAIRARAEEERLEKTKLRSALYERDVKRAQEEQERAETIEALKQLAKTPGIRKENH